MRSLAATSTLTRSFINLINKVLISMMSWQGIHNFSFIHIIANDSFFFHSSFSLSRVAVNDALLELSCPSSSLNSFCRCLQYKRSSLPSYIYVHFYRNSKKAEQKYTRVKAQRKALEGT